MIEVGSSERSRLLRDNPGFRSMCASRAVSSIGDGITTTVLVLLVAGRDGAAGVSLLLLAEALPRLAGPLAGALADRLDTRRLMATCELASALVIGVVALLLPPLPVLLVLVAVAGALATIRNPAGRSVLPQLVGPDDRVPANALFSLAGNLRLAVGPALGGLLAAGTGGYGVALAVDAATFAASALLLLGLPAIAPARDPAAITGVWAEAAAGLRYTASNRTVRVLVLSLLLLVTFAAIDNVALVFLTEGELAAGPAGFGAAAGAFGVGMLLAAAACTRLARGRSPVALLVGAVAVTAVGTVATGLAPALAVVIAAQLLAGSGNAVENIAYDTVVQGIVPRPLLGRVFGTVGTAAQLGVSLAAVVGGVLVQLAGARATFVIAGIGTLATLAVLLRELRRSGPAPQARPWPAGEDPPRPPG
jgi:MFS family permease